MLPEGWCLRSRTCIKYTCLRFWVVCLEKGPLQAPSSFQSYFRLKKKKKKWESAWTNDRHINRDRVLVGNTLPSKEPPPRLPHRRAPAYCCHGRLLSPTLRASGPVHEQLACIPRFTGGHQMKMDCAMALPSFLTPHLLTSPMHRHTDLLQMHNWRGKNRWAILLSHYNTKYHPNSKSDSFQTLL